MSLRTRFAVLTAVTVAAAIAGASAIAYLVVDHVLSRELDRGLARQATTFERDLRARGWGMTGLCTWPDLPCAQTVTVSGRVDPAERPLPVDAAVRRIAAGNGEAFYADVRSQGHPVRMLTRPLGAGRALQVGRRTDATQRSLGQVRAALLVIAFGGVAVAAGLGLLVARGALRPITRLTEAAERVAATRDPAHRIDTGPSGGPGGGTDELGRLAVTFNGMLGALEEALEAQRRLVADASHELRTPLTSLRADIDLVERLPPERREQVFARVRTQLARLGDLVGDLVELARGEAPGDPIEDVHLDRLVSRCVEDARSRWPDVEFTASVGESLVSGRPRRLGRAIANLLDNAAKFGGAYGPVVVELRAGRLTVRDHGPGIDPADAPYVFDRFYRAPGVRELPGSGLGLAIVAQVALEHEAELFAGHAPGGGTLIRLTLPER